MSSAAKQWFFVMVFIPLSLFFWRLTESLGHLCAILFMEKVHRHGQAQSNRTIKKYTSSIGSIVHVAATTSMGKVAHFRNCTG